MRNDKGYRDPTASIAIGRVAKEEKRKSKMLKNRDGTPFAAHSGVKADRTWNDVLKEFNEIDRGQHA